MWHQPCQCCKVHHFGGYSKLKKNIKLVTHVKPHASAMRLLKRAKKIAINHQNKKKQHQIWDPEDPISNLETCVGASHSQLCVSVLYPSNWDPGNREKLNTKAAPSLE